jgi:imidazole glycerol-phosphate synthase subunit HisH
MAAGCRSSWWTDVIGIVDYGLGNLRSVQGALEFLGSESTISRDPTVLLASDRLILPGVGSFREAMRNIHDKGLFDVLRSYALEHHKPMLGICLGMQLLSERGEEDGDTPGLGLIPGCVRHFPAIELPVPHVGFNTTRFVERSVSLFGGLGNQAEFYFVHSYRFEVTDSENVSAWCDYGEPFAAAVQHGRVFGTQFHPEKSQTNGLRVLKNFIQLGA